MFRSIEFSHFSKFKVRLSLEMKFLIPPFAVNNTSSPNHWKMVVGLVLAFFLLASDGWGQNLKTAQWRFGNGAGLDFNSGTAQAVSPSHAMNALEECSSIADAAGNLLFYSNSKTVWNRNNVAMFNGTGLLGESANAQGLIVAKPGTTDQYYIIYNAWNNNVTVGLSYTLVDMSLQNGLGAVVPGQKNIVIDSTGGSEDFSAVHHTNGQDIWILYHKSGSFNNSDTLCSVLLTSNGFTTPIVTQSVGYSFHQNSGWKASPKGDYLAAGIFINNQYETGLYAFDATTGAYSNLIIIQQPHAEYAFSCDGQVLYLRTDLTLYQYDLSSGDSLTIVTSETAVGSLDIGDNAIQLAPNGKIYLTKAWSNNLSVINQPHILGSGCDFQSNVVPVQPGTSNFGLPGFNQSCLQCYPIMTDTGDCAGDTTFFHLINAHHIDSVIWDFGDPPSGVLNSDTGISPTHIYTSGGLKVVQAVFYHQGVPDTLTKTISILGLPSISLIPDTAICSFDSLLLVPVGVNFTGYNWSTGSTDSTQMGYPGNTYFLTVTGVCGTAVDSIILDTLFPPNGSLGPDTTLCAGDSILLQGLTSTNLWSDNSTDTSLLVLQAGTYWVQSSNACGSVSDTISFLWDTIPVVNLGNDTVLCEGDSITATFNGSQVSYLWKDGSTDSNFLVLSPDTIWVTVSNVCGSTSDTVIIDSLIPALVQFPGDTLLCPGETLILDATVALGTYLWQDGSSGPIFSPNQSGNYWAEASNFCGVSSDTISIQFVDFPFVDLPPDTVICENDSVVLDATQPGAWYSWQNLSTNSVQVVQNAGFYWIEVSNECGTVTDSLNVFLHDSVLFDLGVDTMLCVGDSLEISTFLSQDYPHFWQDSSSLNHYLVLVGGNYWVFVSNVCGEGSDSVVVGFADVPHIDFGHDPTLCTGDTLALDLASPYAQYHWSTGDTSAQIKVTTSGQFWGRATNYCGTGSDTLLVIFEDSLHPELGPKRWRCVGKSETVDPGLHQPASYWWSTSTTDPTIIVDTSGWYWVEVENTCGLASDTLEIHFSEKPEVQLGPDTTLCEGDSVWIFAHSSGDSLLWNTGDTGTQIRVTETGMYRVIGYNYCGQDTAEMNVEVEALPRVSIEADSMICPGESVVLYATPSNLNYTWQDGSFGNTYSTSTTGMYWAHGESQVGCDGSDTLEIIPCAVLWFPNAFTPNGDGKNDVFKAEGESLNQFSLQIFNRWGEVIYKSSNPDQGWDGNYQGLPAPEGVYSWKAAYINHQRREKIVVGKVSLVRKGR